MHLENHVCSNDAIKVVVYVNGSPHTYWNTYQTDDWETILQDMGVDPDNVGMDTLDKLRLTFPKYLNSLEHLESFKYIGMEVKILCEGI